jgi:YbgC/YbaW family acyl-CoA thioester hydrolase
MRLPASPHRLTLRVYYEDTDLAGIVYYANYLRFIERARTEWVRELGIDQGRLKAEAGIVFAVRRVEVDYIAPARFDDVLEVETACLEDHGGAGRAGAAGLAGRRASGWKWKPSRSRRRSTSPCGRSSFGRPSRSRS